MKTREGWNESRLDLSHYLQVGDEVDETLQDYFLCVLPPAYWKHGIIQIGEPCDFVQGRQTFSTIYKDWDGVWRYAGECHRGATENMRSAA